MNVFPFPADDERNSCRIKALHYEHQQLKDLDAAAGTPDEWLATAIAHLKVQTSGAERRGGSTMVSVAAIDLVLMRLEALEHGGEPWAGNRP